MTGDRWWETKACEFSAVSRFRVDEGEPGVLKTPGDIAQALSSAGMPVAIVEDKKGEPLSLVGRGSRFELRDLAAPLDKLLDKLPALVVVPSSYPFDEGDAVTDLAALLDELRSEGLIIEEEGGNRRVLPAGAVHEGLPPQAHVPGITKGGLPGHIRPPSRPTFVCTSCEPVRVTILPVGSAPPMCPKEGHGPMTRRP